MHSKIVRSETAVTRKSRSSCVKRSQALPLWQGCRGMFSLLFASHTRLSLPRELCTKQLLHHLSVRCIACAPRFTVLAAVVLVLSSAGFQQRFVKFSLLFLRLVDALVHCSAAHQFVHGDLLGLADAMAPILRLSINMRIEVEVVNNHRVRRRQVDAKPARPR